ncbi:DUF3795 domain-containing protein [Rhizomicrobium electricum]|uniref:DUF3795 domain-containing protein n=2 Tax=Rhizomicrobium electricum TaxID=480070 RepID=A0ABP3QFR8_9PROT
MAGRGGIAMPVFKTTDIAPCGLNCGRCHGRFRKGNPCPGCRSKTAAAAHLALCSMRNCTKRKQVLCGGCGAFPCARLKNIDKRYRTKYATQPIDNLLFIKANGLRRFVAKEEAEHVRGGCIRCMHGGKFFPIPPRRKV